MPTRLASPQFFSRGGGFTRKEPSGPQWSSGTAVPSFPYRQSPNANSPFVVSDTPRQEWGGVLVGGEEENGFDLRLGD